GYLNDIASDDIKAAKSLQQTLCLVGGEPSHHRRSGGERGIEPVNVEGDVGGTGTDNIARRLNDSGDAKVVESIDIDDRHSGLDGERFKLGIRIANADVHSALGIEHAGSRGVEERRAVMQRRTGDLLRSIE